MNSVLSPKTIRKMVDDGEYFTVNRARQFGKTTNLVNFQLFMVMKNMKYSGYQRDNQV